MTLSRLILGVDRGRCVFLVRVMMKVDRAVRVRVRVRVRLVSIKSNV